MSRQNDQDQAVVTRFNGLEQELDQLRADYSRLSTACQEHANAAQALEHERDALQGQWKQSYFQHIWLVELAKSVLHWYETHTTPKDASEPFEALRSAVLGPPDRRLRCPECWGGQGVHCGRCDGTGYVERDTLRAAPRVTDDQPWIDAGCPQLGNESVIEIHQMLQRSQRALFDLKTKHTELVNENVRLRSLLPIPDSIYAELETRHTELVKEVEGDNGLRAKAEAGWALAQARLAEINRLQAK